MIWKNIVGYEGQYLISDSGVVKKVNGVEVGQWMSDSGYMLVRLANPRKTMRVHRLVAEAFIPNTDKKPFINHIDFIRHNNNKDNIEWCTQWENLHHSRKSGRMQNNYWKGKRSPNAKITDEMAKEIKDIYAKGGISWECIGKHFKVSKRTIGRIIKGDSYV